jgi:hydrogenase maturation protease
VRDALPDAGGRAVVAVVGVGNSWRGDDAVGLVVARRVRDALPGVTVVECEGEPVALLDAWEGADMAWVVDAVSSGAALGTVHRLEASAQELPRELFRASTHAFGLAESIELGRALGRLPARLVVFGIEGASFAAGDGLTAAVEAAAGRVVDAILEEVEACTRRP